MIEFYIDGRSFNDEGCGFSVILRSFKHVWIRGLLLDKKITTNQADLMAIKYCLLSLKKSNEAHVIFRNKYISYIFVKDGDEWKKKDLDKNKELITEVRDLVMKHNITFHHDPDNDIFKSLLKKTESMVKEQKDYFVR